jgi:hypothetical protein
MQQQEIGLVNGFIFRNYLGHTMYSGWLSIMPRLIPMNMALMRVVPNTERNVCGLKEGRKERRTIRGRKGGRNQKEGIKRKEQNEGTK